jgi:hypothetical protein
MGGNIKAQQAQGLVEFIKVGKPCTNKIPIRSILIFS